MIGRWGSRSATYLRVLAVGTLLAFGLPMLISPLRWAEALGWQIPGETDLAIYFGRCLASLVCVLGVMGLRVARSRPLQPLFFDILLGATAFMTAVHAYGALRGIQPTSETIEIAFWALLVLLTLLFHPGGRRA